MLLANTEGVAQLQSEGGIYNLRLGPSIFTTCDNMSYICELQIIQYIELYL